MHPKYLTTLSSTILALLFVLTESHPINDSPSSDEVEVELSQPLQAKQEDVDGDEDEEKVTTPRGPSFGGQVAQIINGVASGDLSSILAGSFNLVPNKEVSDKIHTAWGNVAGVHQVPTSRTTTTLAPTALLNSTAPTTEQTKVSVTTEAEVEEVETEATTSSSAPANNEDDDDDEEVGDEFEGITPSEDNSVYSRSKVLRVI